MGPGSGPRYIDWSHVHVKGGDKDKAAPYLPDARKLLGFVMDEAKRNNLGSHKVKKVLQDGTIIIAEKIGAIPRMTIIPKGGQQPREIRTLEGFFFARRNAATPENTSAMVCPPKAAGEDTAEGDAPWKAMFYGADADGYDLAPDDRRGTYIDVFGTKAKSPWQRMETAGGLWMDRKTKEAVTWFRGYLGYWPMHFRHPISNYAPFVSIYGHLVYTVSDETPDWRVMCAAKREGWLYVLIAEDLGALDPPPRPGVATESGQVWFSQPYTDAMYTYALWRFPLGVVTQPDTLIETYKALVSGGERLWRGELELAYGAWSFDAECTKVVTVQLPRRAMLAFHVYIDGDVWKNSTDYDNDYPIIEAQRIELDITHGTGMPTVAYNESVAPTLIAEEDGVQLELVLASHGTDPTYPDITTYSRMEYQCGDLHVVAFEGESPSLMKAQVSRTIVYAHLPTRTFVFLKRALGEGFYRTVDINCEVYIEGELVDIPPGDDPFAVSTALGSYATPSVHALMEAKLKVPWSGVYSAVNTFALKVEMDAMTFLLGISFDRRSSGDATVSGGPFSQAYLIPTIPYIPFSCRIATGVTAVLSGGVAQHSGAGGWSVSKHGGPGPTFAWDDGNTFAPIVAFNQGAYADPTPAVGPFPGAFGSVGSFGPDVLIAAKLDPWGSGADNPGGGSPYPYAGSDDGSLYPLRLAVRKDGEKLSDAMPLIDAIDPRLETATTLYYSTYTIGHTGKPMTSQAKRFMK